MKAIAKKAALILLIILLLTVIAVCAAFLILHIRTDRLHDDISDVIRSDKYGTAVSVDGIDVIKQDVSCGYAVMEMFSQYCGGDVTEQKLYDDYGRVVTSTGGSFCDEMNKQFAGYSTAMHKYLSDSELLKTVHDSLSAGVPVPFEWAAKLDGEWTLHYSLITGMDLANDCITVANPYGYYETLTAKQLLERTSFEAYEDMPLFLRMGFAFGIFEKNTVFTAVPK